MNNRGITTLMIVSLLLVFFFAAGVLIYTFFFGPPVAEGECGVNIGWSIMKIEGKEDICHDQKAKQIRFTIENGLRLPLEGVLVKVRTAESETATLLGEAKTGRAGAVVGDVAFDSETDGRLEAVQIFPVVVVEDEELACSDHILEKQQLEPCAFYFY